ncbi:hypothetical protein PGN35_006865 [Nodosilinea sp. PGN35]|uniref:hypothetical protein n=1 Tax=Nodosilinea sp. PGN35 TaxID=3020489 RepID=UPI0023B2A2BB|nr:hypothetical protein [Nodosilinea sp. TSF1-S3]MDF0365976.1 hypothetical protein [Nodosilinea sp. TSF1-S3]
MFDHLEPDADGASNASPAPEHASLPVPPNSGLPGKAPRPLTPEKVRHMLYGSLAGIDRTIKILHAIGYADPNDWSDPIPVPQSDANPGTKPNQWMVIMTKTVLLE